MTPLTVNGRAYRPPRREPFRPAVAVCLDGCGPDYLDDALGRGLLPHLARFAETGHYGAADGVIPSFTNPNNLSIVTGAPPSVHGICGNFFLDPDTGEAVMMNQPRFLRAETLLAAFSRAGETVAVVTAKDKLRALLGHGLRGGICFSAEKAHQAREDTHGIGQVNRRLGRDTPPVYSAELSEFVMAAGVWLLAEARPGLLYLSTTDYVQHRHPPGHPVSDRFLQALDDAWGALDEAGAVVGLTADHGMNAKQTPAGGPDVIHLEPLLAAWLGHRRARVILPITDPYVAHHGALGAFATVYLEAAAEVEPVLARLRETPGVDDALPRHEACARFELPPDRLGDVVVLAGRHTVLGRSPAAHDLSQLDAPLRSHGGLAEGRVPFVLNRPLAPAYRDRAAAGALRNFDLFDFLLNGTLD